MAEEKATTTNTGEAPLEAQSANQEDAVKTTTTPRVKRAFTATVVTFALTALLIFMVVWILVTGKEDTYGVISGATVLITSAVNFYFGTKNGGTNV